MSNILTAAAPTETPEQFEQPATATLSAPSAGVSIRAFVCGILALLTSPVAVVWWPFMIVAAVLAVLGLRRRAAKRWMNVVALVLVGLALLGTFVLPTLGVGVGFLMFGEVAPEAVLETYWHFWVGQYLVVG